jgi:ferredoxin
MTRRVAGVRIEQLRVDPVACDGVGICSHLAADLITVDSWGFPIVAEEPLDGRTRRQAKAAVAACPRRALFLTDVRP